MIKLSLQSLSYRDTARAGKIDLLGIIERAAELRLDGVDLHSGQFESTEPAYLEELKLAAMRGGLHVCYLGVSNDFGKTGTELEQQVSRVNFWVDAARTMGAPMVRVFGAWVPDGEREESVWPRLISASRKVTEYARSQGVVLGLHNHNHGCIPATGQQVLRLLDEVGDPYYSHILDTGQYRGSPGASLGERGVEDQTEDFYGSIELSAPRAVHVRAKGVPYTFRQRGLAGLRPHHADHHALQIQRLDVDSLRGSGRSRRRDGCADGDGLLEKNASATRRVKPVRTPLTQEA